MLSKRVSNLRVVISRRDGRSYVITMDSNGSTPVEARRDNHKTRVKHGELDMATRAQIVALKAFGVKNDEITKTLGLEHSIVYRIWNRAKERGFDPDHPIVRDHHVKTEHRSGRPRKPREGHDRCRCKKILCAKGVLKIALRSKRFVLKQISSPLKQLRLLRAKTALGSLRNVDDHMPIQGEMDVSHGEALPALARSGHLASAVGYPILNPEAIVQPCPIADSNVRDRLYHHGLCKTRA